LFGRPGLSKVICLGKGTPAKKGVEVGGVLLSRESALIRNKLKGRAERGEGTGPSVGADYVYGKVATPARVWGDVWTVKQSYVDPLRR